MNSGFSLIKFLHTQNVPEMLGGHSMTNVIVHILQIEKVRLQLRNPLTNPLLLVESNFMRF